MILQLTFFLAAFVHLAWSSLDPIDSLSYQLDRASLEIMQRFDSAEERRTRIVRNSQQTGGRQELLFRKTIPIQKLQMTNPTDILHISMNTESDKKEHLLVISNSNIASPVIGNPSTVDVYRFDNSTEKFYQIHYFREVDPFELEYFTIQRHGKVRHLLAIAGNSNAVTRGLITTRVVIFEISLSGGVFSFPQFQDFASLSVASMKSASRDNITYLVFGMRMDHSVALRHSNTPAQVLVLQYNPAINAFQFHSTLPANIISDIELFNVEKMLLMTVAYYRDNKNSLDLNSPVYKFNDAMKKFELLQTIKTHGARDIENFRIIDGDYIVIANEASDMASLPTYGVPSAVYKFIGGKYELVQNIPTYGAVRWKSTTIPNCQNSVLLFYTDRVDNRDQVGLYMYAENVMKFTEIPLSFYHSVRSTFRPRPNTLVPFMIKDDLFIAIGAADTTAGESVYQIEYSTIESGSPWEKFASDVRAMLAELNENLTTITKDVLQLEDFVGNIVYRDEEQNITGFKAFADQATIENMEVNDLDVSKGSIHFKENNTFHDADPKRFTNDNISDIKATARMQAEAVKRINETIKDLFIIKNDNLVTNYYNFSHLRLASLRNTADNLLTSSCEINNINTCELVSDIVFKNSTDVISGRKIFGADQLLEKNLEVNGKINTVVLEEDLVLKTGNQMINVSKTFEAETKFMSVNVSGNVNGIDVSEEALLLDKVEAIKGYKTFEESVEASGINIKGLIDGVNVESLKNNTMLLNTEQNVTGRKEFTNNTGMSSLGNISVSGLTNGIDIDEFARKVVRIDGDVIELTGNKIFEDRVTVEGNISVWGKVNGMVFPDVVLLVSKKQNITGVKEFLSSVAVKDDVTVQGLIDGVNVSDLVTLDGDDFISGRKIFYEEVKITENVNIATSRKVNKVDVSELGRNVFKINGKQNISGFTAFQNVVSENDLEISGMIDDVNLRFYEDLFRNAVLLEGDQMIDGNKSFKDIHVTGNATIEGRVNGFKIPQSFLDRFSSQIFTKKFNFTNVLLQSGADINGTLDGVDLSRLRKELVTIDGEQSISGKKVLNSDLTVDGDVTACCAINNVSLSSLMTKKTEQVVTAKKHFDKVIVKNVVYVIGNNVTVERTVNGVDLSNISKKVHFMNENIHVNNAIHFENVTAAGLLSGTVNHVDIRQLANDAVLLNSDQVITSNKTFADMKMKGNLKTNSTIDGYDVSHLKHEVVMVDYNGDVHGKKVFKKIEAMADLKIDGLIQNINLSKLVEEVVLRTGDYNISGLKYVKGKLVIDENTNSKSVNGLDVSRDVVLKSLPQNITGTKTFTENMRVRGDIVIGGNVNGVDVSDLDRAAVKKNIPQVIKGKKILRKTLYSKGNVSLSGTVDGVDLSELRRSVINIDQDQEFAGDMKIDEITRFEGNINTNGTVNGYNLTDIFDDAVTINGTQVITAAKIFKANLAVKGELNINHNDTWIHGLINGVNITQLAADVVDCCTNQTIGGYKTFSRKVTFENIEVGGINGHLVSDYVTNFGNQSIYGLKTFKKSINAICDISVKGLVDGENLNALGDDTILLKSNLTQFVVGKKTFKDGLLLQANMSLSGTLDGISMNKDGIITLHTDQIVYGNATFGDNVVAKSDIELVGLLSGFNISDMYRNRITLNTPQNITGIMVVASDAVLVGDCFVNGTVNGEDLGDWTYTIRSVLFDAWTYGIHVHIMSRETCAALHYVNAHTLKSSPLRLDYFNDYQSFQYGINSIEPFQIRNESYIAITSIKSPVSGCTPCIIMKHSNTLGKFIVHQYLATSGGSKFRAFSAGDDTYLFLGNKEDGCLRAGYSILYKWNQSTRKFHEIQNIPTNVVTDAYTLPYSNQTVLLAIANADKKTYNSSLSMWKISANESKVCLIQNISTSMPHSVVMFGIESQYYMAIAMSFNTTLLSTKASSTIYRLNQTSLRWDLVQKIPTADASDFAHFNDDRHHFLAVSNKGSRNQQTTIHQVLGVEVYQFLPAQGLFVLVYSIPLPYSIGLQPFTFQRSLYLSVAIKNKGINVYMFKPHFGYQLLQFIPQPGITYHEVFSIGNDFYMAVESERAANTKASAIELSPRILKAQFSGIIASEYEGCF